jgi:hypothetical protein
MPCGQWFADHDWSAKHHEQPAAQDVWQQPDVGSVRYTDNAEGAFSMEVPVGWQVESGMYRFG